MRFSIYNLITSFLIRRTNTPVRPGPGKRTVLNLRPSHPGKSPDYYRPVGRARKA